MKTEPIRDYQDIQQMKAYFYDREYYRDYVMFVLGINTALRISDLLQLKWKDVWDFFSCNTKKHVDLIEQKTKKRKRFLLNQEAKKAITLYYKKLDCVDPETHLFKSNKGKNRPISRNRAYTILKEAAAQLHLEGNISCHSLRKTFGYHAWKSGISPAILMEIYNHSSMEVTKIYLAVDQDDKDEVYRKITL